MLLPQVGKLDRLIGDTAYYQIERNEKLLTSGVVPVIPPKADAVEGSGANRLIGLVKVAIQSIWWPTSPFPSERLRTSS